MHLKGLKVTPRSITPALTQALRVVAKQAKDGNVYTTKDLSKIMSAELQVSYPGGHQRIELENAQCDTTLEDHIVLQPQPAARIPDREP